MDEPQTSQYRGVSMTISPDLRLVWIDPVCEYPTYTDLTDANPYASNYDIALPLAFVCLRTYLSKYRPRITIKYHPRRLYEAMGLHFSLADLVQDGDVILTSCSTADSPDAQRILAAAKEAGRTTIVGGIYPRFSAQDVLNWGTADYVCIGEGEKALVSALDQITTGNAPAHRRGIVTPDLPTAQQPELLDLSELPEPDYTGLPVDDFLPYMNSAYILATRGCPAPCHFCTSARQYGFSYRTRPVHSVIRELHQLYELGFRRITLADDTVLVDQDWANDLFQAIARSNPGYRLKVRARADELSPAMISRMADAGVEVVQFGVESISQVTRERMHKRLDRHAIDRAFQLVLGASDMLANPLYMLAYPGETWAECEENVTFIKAMGADTRVLTYLSFTTPYPGTGFSKTLGPAKGMLLTSDLRYYTNKFPVYLPASLNSGDPIASLQLLVNIYEDLCAFLNRYTAIHKPIPMQFYSDIDPHVLAD
jgi:anaerobic magnesium-protoporphyrin IX monomethyl ester cyclase